MRLLAAFAAGTSVYLLVGLLTGRAPRTSVRRPRRVHRISAFLRQAGLATSPGQFLAVSACLSGATFVAVWALTGAAPVAVVPALGAGAIPWVWFARQRQRLGRQREMAWPDALRHLVASLEVPMSLHRALVALGRTGPEPLRDVFARYELMATLDQTAALQAIRQDLSDPLADRIVEVLLVAQSKGNRVVVDILRDLAEHTAADVRLDEDIETANLEKRIEARSAVVLPFAVLILLCSSSEPYRDFYSTPRGAFVIVLGALMALAGMAMISRLGRLPSEPRVLVVDPGEPRR
jgi:tight adherence protein B